MIALIVVSCSIGETRGVTINDPSDAEAAQDEPSQVFVAARDQVTQDDVTQDDVTEDVGSPTDVTPAEVSHADVAQAVVTQADATDDPAFVDVEIDEAVVVRIAPAPAFGVLAWDAAASPTMRHIASPMGWTTPVPLFVLRGDATAEREHSLARRAERRAFEGAPPTIPHSSTFGVGSRACTDCHEQGMAIGRKVAHPMSHPAMTQCLQCHVEQRNPLFELPAPIENAFTPPAPVSREERLENGPPL